MRKFLFIIFMVITWYVAAMFRIEALLVLAVMEILIIIAMFFCMLYFKWSFISRSPSQNLVITRKDVSECAFEIENRGLLPISRFRIFYTYLYHNELDGESHKYCGNLDAKSKETIGLDLDTPYSGKMEIFLDKVYVYDYFAFFKGRIKTEEKLSLIILPPDRRFTIGSPESGIVGDNNTQSQEYEWLANNTEEFLQLREYIQGDLYQNIHWKQSARTDTIWIKEYEQEQRKNLGLYLSFYGYEDKEPSEISAFYEILWAIIQGVTEKNYLLKIYWRDFSETEICKLVTDQDSGIKALIELYEEDWSGRRWNIEFGENNPRIEFGTDLKLLVNGREKISFDFKTYQSKLEQVIKYR